MKDSVKWVQARTGSNIILCTYSFLTTIVYILKIPRTLQSLTFSVADSYLLERRKQSRVKIIKSQPRKGIELKPSEVAQEMTSRKSQEFHLEVSGF